MTDGIGFSPSSTRLLRKLLFPDTARTRLSRPGGVRRQIPRNQRVAVSLTTPNRPFGVHAILVHWIRRQAS
jgi:hypothetical protein